MELQLQSHDTELDPSSRALIESSAKRLGEHFPDFLLRLHANVRGAPHHRKGAFTVTLLANVTGGVLRAEKAGEREREAIHAAFEALEHELRRHHEELRVPTKGAPDCVQGSIKRVFRESGYGFIRYQPGGDVYFHRTALSGLDFDKLEPGLAVEFEVEQGEKGLQAPRVYPVGARART
jgi:cold shock CspA family protein/ribosome-associated translation inhibitor RaiA